MSGSGLGMIHSTHHKSNSTNESNSTELVSLGGGANYIQVAQLILACIQILLCAIALAAIARVRVLRAGKNLYIVNLIISDVFRAIVGLWLFTMAHVDHDYGSQRAESACQTVLFLWHWQFCWSMWGTVLIVQSRHSTIRNPLAAGVTTRKAAITSAFSCLMGIVIAAPPLFTWAKYVIKYNILKDGYFNAFCTRDSSNPATYLSFVLVYFGISYWLPLAIVIYYLIKTLRLVIRSIVERRQLTAMATNGTETEQPAPPIYKSKALWYVIAVVCSNATFPAPYILILLIRTFHSIGSGTFVVAGFIFALNFVVNSVLYCFWVKTLTQSLWNVLCCRKLRNVTVKN